MGPNVDESRRNPLRIDNAVLIGTQISLFIGSNLYVNTFCPSAPS